jgi:hypothetical protein
MLHLDYNKVDVPNLVLILIEHLYWSGMWFGVAPKTLPKLYVLERDWYV